MTTGYQTDDDGYLIGPIALMANPRPDPAIPGDEWIIPRGVVLTSPPSAKAGYRRRWVAGAWVQVKAPAEAPAPPPLTPEEQLELEMETWTPYIRAFVAALKMFPAPGYLHMLDQLMQVIEGKRLQDPYDDLVLWFDKVTIVIRVHPDMEYFRAAFEIPVPLFNLLFITAMALERGDDPVVLQAWVNAQLAEMAGGGA